MVMWLRIGGALLITLAVMAALDSFAGGSFLGERSGDQAPPPPVAGELFWFVIFAVVMATALLAAARRWTGFLRRAAAPRPRLQRRDVA